MGIASLGDRQMTEKEVQRIMVQNWIADGKTDAQIKDLFWMMFGPKISRSAFPMAIGQGVMPPIPHEKKENEL